MLDVRRIRRDLDGVKAELARKGVDGAEVDAVAGADARQRELAARRDELRSQAKATSADDRRRLGEEAAAVAAEVEALAAEVRDRLLAIPNTPHPDAPEGADDRDNPVLRVAGFDPDGHGAHQKVPHWVTGTALGILDLERGAKISGSSSAMLRGAGATLSRALCQHALDANADLYEEVRPPTLVTTATLTAESPLAGIAAGEVLRPAELPLRVMACTPCYRPEAGAVGRDTRGLLRVQELDTVELVAYTTPEQAPAELDAMVARAERLVAGLGLAHRVTEICAGDQGRADHRSYEVEVHAPGVDQWLGVSSISWLSDYQARRAGVRYRGAKGNELVHTLDGALLAVPRVWAAIVETHRQPDGTVRVPAPLLPYMRGIEVIGA